MVAPWIIAVGLVLIGCHDEPLPAELDAAAPDIPASDTGPPDILLITIDTLRADRIGAYGDTQARTPVIDNLAATGILFREAHAVTPLTLPSHATLLTGLLPSEHGLRDNAGFRLDDSVVTLAERLRSRDYQTAAFVSAYVLDSAWGLDRGFQIYHDPFDLSDVDQRAVFDSETRQDGDNRAAFGEVELSSAEVINSAIGWWERTEGDEKRFGWVHLYDPHAPWIEHPEFPGDPYRSEVSHVDQLLRRLVRTVGEDTLIILTSDHGEGLWEHGEREHGITLTRSVTRVPLIVRPPYALSGLATVPDLPSADPPVRRPEGIDEELELGPVPNRPRAARIVETPVSGLDIAATIADFAAAEPTINGRSLRPAIEGGDLEELPIYAESFFPFFHYGWAPMFMSQNSLTRLEHGAYDVWIDWQQDPYGQDGEATPNDELARHIAEGRGEESAPNPDTISPRTSEALHVLGYVTHSPSTTDTDIDPRDQMEIVRMLAAAESTTDLSASIGMLEELISEHPEIIDARLELSVRLAWIQDYEGSILQIREILDRSPNHPIALRNGTSIALAMDDTEQALSWAEQRLSQNPRDVQSHRSLVRVHAQREEPELVHDATAAGLEIDPEDPYLLYFHGRALKMIDRYLDSIPFFERARNAGSEANDIELQIADAYDQAGLLDHAAQAYLNASRDDPSNRAARAQGGRILASLGRCEEARTLMAPLVRHREILPREIRDAMTQCEF